MSEALVTVRIPIYKVDGRESAFPFLSLLVENADNWHDGLTLIIDGHGYTVSARDLAKACDKARWSTP